MRNESQPEAVLERPADFAPDAYHGQCSVCGLAQVFSRSLRAIRETYRCRSCKASLREREQASALLECLPGPRSASLAMLVLDEASRGLRIYEPGTMGPFRPFLQQLPAYRQSDYYPDGPGSRKNPDLPHEDLQALNYGDGSFDVVLTSDILEHVRHPRRAMEEIARVLSPGGWHVCTVPLQWPMPARTRARVDVSGEQDRHLLPAHYHGNGKGGRSLVYNDFGADVVELARDAGFAAQLRRANTGSPVADAVVTLVCQRMAR